MTDKARALLRKRKAAERRFRWYGRLALGLAFVALLWLLATITFTGWSGFLRTEIRLPVRFDTQVIDPAGSNDPAIWAKAHFARLAYRALERQFPQQDAETSVRQLHTLLSSEAALVLRDELLADPDIMGKEKELWLPASAAADFYAKGKVDIALPEAERKLKDTQVKWLDALIQDGRVRKSFNTTFFTTGDSREPEQAGFMGSVIGSLLTLVICMLVAFPLGLCTAVYLEEFAPKNRLTDLIEVNINNLAAVPSIIFGLLGLAVYINVMEMPRSAPVVGGLTLALMTLPVIIITTRVALKAVPPSIREAARAMGASPLQVVTHHVVPLSMPGIMTGTILGMARAIGETAPLLMIGMVAFVADIPTGFTDPATAMPVQVYLWASSPEAGFVEKTSAGILVLLALLMLLNSLAIAIRKRYEVRW